MKVTCFEGSCTVHSASLRLILLLFLYKMQKLGCAQFYFYFYFFNVLLLFFLRLGCSSTCFFCEFIIIWIRSVGWEFGLGGMKYPCTCLLLWFAKVNCYKSEFCVYDALLYSVHPCPYIR